MDDQLKMEYPVAWLVACWGHRSIYMPEKTQLEILTVPSQALFFNLTRQTQNEDLPGVGSAFRMQRTENGVYIHCLH